MSKMKKSKLKQFDTVGRLLLLDRFLKPVGKFGKRESFWYAICECGNTKVARSCSITSKSIASCGCLRSENCKKQLSKAQLINTKYSKVDSNSKLFRVWRGILNRCLYVKQSSKNYKIYRGKGITICDEWKNFHSFKIWSLQNGFDEKLTIDRIDSNKNYEPSNCRFISMEENLKNRNHSYPRPWLIGNKHASKK